MRRLFPPLVCLVAITVPVKADGIPVKTLNALKSATVFVKVDYGRVGMATGSGFLIKADGEIGYVVTNHHVVSAPPKMPAHLVAGRKLSLVFWSGMKKEKVVAAEIVATNPSRDLAILKITGFKELPKPIDLTKKAELAETMTVWTFGFPFGEKLSTTKGNPAMTIGKGSISSIRMDEFDNVKVVQLDGELNPGNSGGPVVDGEGHLVGVAVAKIAQTKIGLAIPPDQLTLMLHGRVGGITIGPRRVADGAADMQARAHLIDPMNKLKAVAIHYLPSDSLKEMLKVGKDGKWSLLPGATKVDLKIDKQTAFAYFKLKPLQASQIEYTFQTAFINGDGNTVYTQPGRFKVDFTKNIEVAQLPGDGRPLPPPGEDLVLKPNKGDDLALAGKAIRHFGAAVDAKSKSAFLTQPNGLLRHYSYPDFKFKGDYKLADGVGAYRIVLDGSRGLLYAAVAPAKGFAPVGPNDRYQGVGHLHVYEVRQILDGKGKPDTELKPAAIIKLGDTGGTVNQLSLSPEGDWLYYLNVKDPSDVRAGKVDTKTRKIKVYARLAEKTEAMCLTRDGKRIYSISSPDGHRYSVQGPQKGKVQMVDTANMKLAKEVELDRDPYDVDASNDGLVFVSGGSGQ
jgi:hypothetical protein